ASDRLPAGAAGGLTASRSLGPIDTCEPLVRQRRACRALELFPFGNVALRLGKRFEQRRRPLAGGASEMEPERHLAIGERIGQALAEAQLAAFDAAAAAPEAGAGVGGGFDEVR